MMKIKFALLVFLVGVFVSPVTQAGDATYDRVMKVGTIRCGYFTWPPYFMIDPNTGQKSGVFYDYVETLGKNLDLKIEWVEEMNFGTYLQDIANGRFDMECTGGWPNAHRGKYAIYSDSIYYIPLVPFVRADDDRFQTVEDLNDPALTVSVIDGENAQTIRKIRFPETKELALPQTASGSQMLVNVMTGKADVTFTDLYSGSEFMANNPGKLKPLFTDTPLQLFPQNFTLAPDAFRFREMLNVATEELVLTGVIDQILDKYEKYSGSFYRLAKPFETR